tara:strand:+ start:1781 stop:2500 length:720 start_codon:yes stop_codon:yes gene_type:complete
MKYKRNPKESRTNFVARIVIEENKPMTAEDIHAVVDKRAGENRGKDKAYWQSFASTAVSTDLIDKTRVVKNHETGGTHVVYHPLGMHPIGEEIPRPLFNRKSKPNFVKVAEDVLSDFIPPHTKHTPIDENVFNKLAMKDFIKHDKNMVKEFDPQRFADAITEQRDAIVSTVKHVFTAEQLLQSLENLNQDLHDDVIVAIFDALGKNNYSPFHHDFTKPQPRKTALLSWAFVDGNLVVNE